MLAFTYARDRYRELEDARVQKAITVLTVVAAIDLAVVIFYDIMVWNVVAIEDKNMF